LAETKIDIPTLRPMEALSVADLPVGDAWVYEPKWDGFRCLALRIEGEIELRSKSGKPLTRYFPDIVTRLAGLRGGDFILDGELVVIRDGNLSFSELQSRLHPSAKRIEKLARESPASFVLFDLLKKGRSDYFRKPFAFRRKKLEDFAAAFAEGDVLTLSPQAGDAKEARVWLKEMRGRIDGIVAKNLNEIYRPEERVMRKYKQEKTADCVVGGFRYGANSKSVGSLLLGLYDDGGLLHHVGFTASIAAAEKPALTKRLEKLKGKPGFTGKAPGGPSRWSTERSAEWTPLRHELVVEVAFDHVSDDRFRHGTKLLRFRDDKAPDQCGMEQLYQS
jgi:ATP-dependent DNA ligase